MARGSFCNVDQWIDISVLNGIWEMGKGEDTVAFLTKMDFKWCVQVSAAQHFGV